MSREELSAFLRNLQLSLDGLQREVEGAIRKVPDTKREALPDLLAGCRRSLARFGAEQLAELDSFAVESGLQVCSAGGGGMLRRAGLPGLLLARLPPLHVGLGPRMLPTCFLRWGSEMGDAATPHRLLRLQLEDAAAAAAASPAAGGGGEGEGAPYDVQLRSLERRVAAMGGIPALGACVLPRMTPGMRPQLNTTASPAAVEIMQRRLGGEEVAALKKTGVSEEEAAPAPLVQLRHTPSPVAAGGQAAARTPLGGAPPNSELAAAIHRRMQRLAIASPEKDASAAATAASKVACEG